MKFAVLADLHLHPHREFSRMIELERFDHTYIVNSRLADQIVALDDTLHELFRRGIKHVFIAGDMFHVRGTVPTEVLQLAIHLFSWWVDKGMKFYALSGNHDQLDAKGNIHATSAFYNLFRNIAWGEDPSHVYFNKSGLHIHMLPWIEDRNLYLEKLQQTIEEARLEDTGDLQHILISHAAIDGAEVGTLEYRLKEPIHVEDLQPDKFNAVFLGHFHKPQNMADNVWYVGSPYQITRAESQDAKRVLIYNSETQKVTQLRTLAKQFYSINYTDIVDKDNLVCLAYGYYDVTAHPDINPVSVRERMAELNVHDFRLIRPRTEGVKKSRMKISKKATDKQLLESFLSAKGIEATPELITAGLNCLVGTSAHGYQAKEIAFEHVRIRNFLSIGKADLNLHQPGSVIAVLGENFDAAGMESNGSGKSSMLPESLVWCLYGTTIRDIPVDKVVNSTKKRNCLVRLRLHVDDHAVVVTRYRKHEEHGSTLSLVVDGVDQTQGTNALTQDKLDNLIGMSLDAFTSIMAFSPDSLHFVAAPDANKKQILDSIVHTERYVGACRAAKEQVKFYTELGQQQQSYMSKIAGRMEANSDHLREFKEKQALNKVKLKEHARTSKQLIAQLTEDMETEQKHLKTITQEVTGLQTQVGVMRSNLPDVKELLEAQNKTNASLREVESQLTELGLKHTEASTSMVNLNRKVGKECPTCKQVIGGEHVGKISAKLDKSMVLLQAQIGPLESQKQNLVEVLADYNLRLRKGDELRTKLDTMLRSLESKQSQKRRLECGIQDIQGEIGEASKPLEVPDFTEHIASTQKTLDEDHALRKEAETAISQANAQKDLFACWVIWFGNKGIKSFMLDKIIPSLTQYANEFADQLTDGDITIEFETNSDGNDKFTIVAYNSEGSDIYGGNSSGERRRIDICVMFALFRLANEQTNINVLLLDEVFDTVDVTGLERIVSMVHTMARELELTIFVTSHTDLRKWLHENIVVSKHNRIATLSGSGAGVEAR